MKINHYLFNKDTHWGWYNHMLPTAWNETMGGFVSIDDDSHRILAAVLYHGWTETMCEMSVIIDNPLVLRHKFLERAFDFVFNTCGREKVIAHVSSFNVKSRNFVEKLGFKEVFRIKDGYARTEDLIIYQYLKEDCRYINNVEELKEAS